jgi:Regulator of Vps4 activity in the MVB pathway
VEFGQGQGRQIYIHTLSYLSHSSYVKGSASVTNLTRWVRYLVLIQLSLSVQRLRTMQQKKEAQAKASRRDIATLIERGKIETARIKIESRRFNYKYYYHFHDNDFNF